jgi:hypothetical protein
LRYVGALALVIVTSVCWLLDGKGTESFGYLIIVSYLAACLLVLPLEAGLLAAMLLVSVLECWIKSTKPKFPSLRCP